MNRLAAHESECEKKHDHDAGKSIRDEGFIFCKPLKIRVVFDSVEKSPAFITEVRILLSCFHRKNLPIFVKNLGCYDKGKSEKVKKKAMQKEVIEVEICKIRMHPHQPRKIFSRNELEELAQSLRSIGMIQPPLVQPLSNEEGIYELISGERRLRAAEIAGMTKIPVLLLDQRLECSAEAALVENIQRVDLNPMEIAAALKRLMIEYHYRQEELADRVGKKRSTIANYLRLFSLPEEMQQALAEEKISMGHAKALLALPSGEFQKSVFRQIVERQWSVRKTEELVRRFLERENIRPSKVSTRDCFLEDVQERIQRRLGTKVTVNGKEKKGQIVIDYYSLDDLDHILECLGMREE